MELLPADLTTLLGYTADPSPKTEQHEPAPADPSRALSESLAHPDGPRVPREVLVAMSRPGGDVRSLDLVLGDTVEGQVRRESDRLRALVSLSRGIQRGQVYIRDAEGRVEFDLSRMPRAERAELQTTLSAAFSGEVRLNRLDARIRFDRNRTPRWAFDLATDLTAVIRQTRIEADGSIRVQGDQVSAELEAAIERSLGPRARVESDLRLRYDASGLEARIKQAFFRNDPNGELEALVDLSAGPDGLNELRLFGAFKRLVGATEYSAEGDLRVRPGSGAEVRAALEILHDGQVEVNADGSVEFDEDGRFADASFRSELQILLERARINADGSIRIDAGGAVQGELETAASLTLGPRAKLDTDLRLSFDDSGIELGRVSADLEAELGPVDVEANLTFDDGLRGALALSALKTLKAESNREAVRFEPSGRVEFDEGRITRAELEALISTANQESVRIDVDGFLRSEDGDIAAEIGARMERFVGGSRLRSSGRLGFRDDRVRAELEAALDTDFVEAEALLGFSEGRPERFRLMVEAAAPNGRVDGLGMLRVDREGLEARLRARFGWDPIQIGVDGSVVVDRPAEVIDGMRHLDRTAIRGTEASLTLPLPWGNLNAGGDLERTERISIRVPEDAPDSLPDDLLQAMKRRSIEAIDELPQGAHIERVLDRERAVELGLRLSTLTTGATGPIRGSFGFDTELRETDLAGVRVERRDDERLNAEIWRIDTRSIARNLSAELGVDLSDTQVAEALRAQLVAGISVTDAVGMVSPEAAAALNEVASRIEIELSTSRSRSSEFSQTVRFEDLDPRNESDRAVVGSLLLDVDPGDVRALPSSRETETRNQRSFELALRAFGLELMMNRSSETELRSVERFEQDGSVFESHAASGRFVQEGRGIFEDHRFEGRMLRLLEQVRGPDGSVQPNELGTMVHVEHQLEDSAWRVHQAQAVERAVRAAGLQILAHERGEVRGWPFRNFGEGDVSLQLALSTDAFSELVNLPSNPLVRRSMEVAAAIEGTTLPPSEVRAPSDLPMGVEAWRAHRQGPGALQRAFPEADHATMDALADRRHTVMIGRYSRAVSILRGRGPVNVDPSVVDRLSRFSDGQLVTLLRQAAAGSLLAEEPPRFQNDREDERERERKTHYRRITDGRDLETDRWIVAQGRAMQEVFQQIHRREENRNALGVTPQDLLRDVEAFVDVVDRMSPSRTGLGRERDREALTFYTTLLSALRAEDAVATVQVDAERYQLRAASPELAERGG